MSIVAVCILFYSYSISLLFPFSPSHSSLCHHYFCLQYRERETRLLVYTLSFIHFPSKPKRTENTMVKYSFTHSLIHSFSMALFLHSFHALSLAFSFQLNNIKGLFGAFALLFSHQHALSPASKSLWSLLFLYCFIVLLLFLQTKSTMECIMSYMRTYTYSLLFLF